MAGDAAQHNELIQREFTRQRPLFLGDGSPFARMAAATLAWLEPLDPEMVVLDVACGAAHASEIAAPYVHQVVGLDLTPALLDAGAERLRALGIGNVLLQRGDAADMPFVDRTFDLVFCRSSVHHFIEPARQVAEMARVCKPAGRVVISDLLAPSAEARSAFDELHRQIDPSHVRAQLEPELLELVTKLVGPVSYHRATTQPPLALDAMLNDASQREPVVAALRRELDGGPITGFEPSLGDDGVLHVAFTTMVVEATRP